ncbi:hypothetical protein BJ508DRAFT_313536 [Ascobolus immersus RN42]|uniref:Uncharacterized protein n=1 Tax=Ascobolus immersus RN42 TaxID=1160509 RepID=A0A3N4HK63_ASCIM|nr:hypothetical protein BJ508DRAFT_313536 [Ascobolus immersus RN42]
MESLLLPSWMLLRIIRLRIRQLEYQTRRDSFEERLIEVKKHYKPQSTTNQKPEDVDLESWCQQRIQLGWPSITSANIKEEEKRIELLETSLETQFADMDTMETAVKSKITAFSTPRLPPDENPTINPAHTLEQRIRKAEIKRAEIEARARCYNARVKELKSEHPIAFAEAERGDPEVFEVGSNDEGYINEGNLEGWEKELHVRQHMMMHFRVCIAYVEAHAKLEKVIGKLHFDVGEKSNRGPTNRVGGKLGDTKNKQFQSPVPFTPFPPPLPIPRTLSEGRMKNTASNPLSTNQPRSTKNALSTRIRALHARQQHILTQFDFANKRCQSQHAANADVYTSVNPSINCEFVPLNMPTFAQATPTDHKEMDRQEREAEFYEIGLQRWKVQLIFLEKQEAAFLEAETEEKQDAAILDALQYAKREGLYTGPDPSMMREAFKIVAEGIPLPQLNLFWPSNHGIPGLTLSTDHARTTRCFLESFQTPSPLQHQQPTVSTNKAISQTNITPNSMEAPTILPAMRARMINLRIRQIEYDIQADKFNERCHVLQRHYMEQESDDEDKEWDDDIPVEKAEPSEFEKWMERTVQPGWPAITPEDVAEQEKEITELEEELKSKSDDVGAIEIAISKQATALSAMDVALDENPKVDPKLSIEQRVRNTKKRLATFYTRVNCFNARGKEVMLDLPHMYGDSKKREHAPLEVSVGEDEEEVSEENIDVWEKSLHRREQVLLTYRLKMLAMEASAKMNHVIGKHLGRPPV